MYTITITKEVTSDRNLCDHIWVEEVFLTKVGVFLKALFTRLDGERCGLKMNSLNKVREVNMNNQHKIKIMTEKTYNLIEGVTRGSIIIAVAVVSYCCDGGTAALVDSALLIAEEAALKICKLFIKK